MMRHTGERNRVLAPFVSGRQSKTKNTRGDLGIVEEHLVEITHAEEQYRVALLRLDRRVLLHHGCHVAHRCSLQKLGGGIGRGLDIQSGLLRGYL